MGESYPWYGKNGMVWYGVNPSYYWSSVKYVIKSTKRKMAMVHINFLVFVVLTIITCVLGDYIVFTAFQNQMTIIKALGDSSIHGLVALFSWLIIQNEAFLQAIICAAIAMMIDVDHFIQGKSLL